MPIPERAKQFMPFSALKGLNEALANKEKVSESKVNISEEQATALNEKMNCVRKGSIVTVTYFCMDTYVRVTGKVDQLDLIYRTLQIEDWTIKFDDILNLELAEEDQTCENDRTCEVD
ncbi:YolD-like family protein [Fusibacter sp. Q10-2]|uniref:YolD-like family protein n=2 Tax=Fusibacter ferrireducens TaxID=2785058 RepID=A0ABR9ZQ73_9FIRM|nr:YolD-like family protein [Fusibacter ferrireducens]